MISETLYSSRSEEWATPQEFYGRLDKEFGFDTDVCATPENAKCERYFTKEDDGLSQDWGDKNWCNPPYGKDIAKWMQKAYEESQKGKLVVCLVHSRTDTRWFHNWVYGKAELRFVKGRLKFGGSKYSAPFPSLIVIYKPKETQHD